MPIHSQILADLARKWIAQNYPELTPPPVTVIPATAARRPMTITAKRAIASSGNGGIRLYDRRLLADVNRMGRERAYSAAYQRGSLQTMIHELLHRVGPPTGPTGVDRSWEEGLSERVAADIAPQFANSIYRPEQGPWARDPRRRQYDFSFRPDSYPHQVRAVENVSYDHAAQALGGRGGILGNAILTPAAQAYRRELVPMSAEARRASITKTQRRKTAEVKQARSAKRQVATKAKDSSNSVAAAIQKVVARTKYRKQPPAPGRPR